MTVPIARTRESRSDGMRVGGNEGGAFCRLDVDTSSNDVLSNGSHRSGAFCLRSVVDYFSFFS
jgi:hypothetical protein